MRKNVVIVFACMIFLQSTGEELATQQKEFWESFHDIFSITQWKQYNSLNHRKLPDGTWDGIWSKPPFEFNGKEYATPPEIRLGDSTKGAPGNGTLDVPIKNKYGFFHVTLSSMHGNGIYDSMCITASDSIDPQLDKSFRNAYPMREIFNMLKKQCEDAKLKLDFSSTASGSEYVSYQFQDKRFIGMSLNGSHIQIDLGLPPSFKPKHVMQK